MLRIIPQAWTLLLCVPLLLSCASYNKSMNGYYTDMQEQNYSKAMRSLEHNRLIKKNRNALLYNLEMGNLYRLQNNFASSNAYLNRADQLLESNRKSLSDVALGKLLNPMQEAYRGEDFEQFMLHFYKALNYSSLGQTEDAVVEARRITLATNTQGNKFHDNVSRYTKDAFALNLQGMIYEAAGDINNAFISYRNAAEVYNKAGETYYGVSLPQQLQTDASRTAALMGFTDLKLPLAQPLQASYSAALPENGELILFLEEGQAPVKEEANFVLSANSDGIGSFHYIDPAGQGADFNFNYGAYGIGEDKLRSIRTFRIALPRYRVRYDQQQPVTIAMNGNLYTPQLAQDINSLAVNTLKERFVTELASALARQITKKVVEKGAELATKEIAKGADKKADKPADSAEKEKEEKKRAEKAAVAGEVAGFVLNMVNTATEKADTRNWQSLPAFVSYVRIPLQAGDNKIAVSYNGKTINVDAVGGKGLQLRSVRIN